MAGGGCIGAGQTLIFTWLASVLFKKDGMMINIQVLGSERVCGFCCLFFSSFEQWLIIYF